MSDLVLEHLKAMRNELRDIKKRSEEQYLDLRSRISALEGFSSRTMLHQSEDTLRQQIAIDQINDRLDLVQKRLDLI